MRSTQYPTCFIVLCRVRIRRPGGALAALGLTSLGVVLTLYLVKACVVVACLAFFLAKFLSFPGWHCLRLKSRLAGGNCFVCQQ